MRQIETRTPEGEHAYSLLDWANADPPKRAVIARDQVNDIARSLLDNGGSTEALNEVRDAGTILYRLASAVQPVPAAFSGIALQVIDLGVFDPAHHPRDPRTGKFVKEAGSGIAEQFARAVGPAMARGTGRRPAGGIAQALGPAMARGGGERDAGPAGDLSMIISNLKESFPSVAEPGPNPPIAKESEVQALEDRMKKDIEQLEALNKKTEHDIDETSRAQLAMEILAIVGGAAIAFFLGGEVIAAATILPFLVKAAIEKGPDLIKAIAGYHIADEGHGREWFAHPVRKPKEAVIRPAVAKVVPKVKKAATPAAVARQMLRGKPRASSPASLPATAWTRPRPGPGAGLRSRSTPWITGTSWRNQASPRTSSWKN